MGSQSRNHILAGALGLCVLVALVALSIAQFDRVFDRLVPVTVRAPRSGLLMQADAAVKIKGVDVGRVLEVLPEGGEVVVKLGIFPDQLHVIPRDVTARLVPTTVFGAKYVELDTPRRVTPAPALAAGATIGPAQVTTEINDTFDNMMATLTAAQPRRLNQALGGLAQSLQGQGANIAGLIVTTDAYLRQFNTSLPALNEDIGSITRVSDVYTGVTPDLLRILDHVSVTGRTISDRKSQVATFFTSFARLGSDTNDFLSQNEDPLMRALKHTQPTLRTLDRYSPTYGCLIDGLLRNRDLLRQVIGGTTPTVNVQATVGASNANPYQYPRDLPKVAADDGPDCHGLPIVNQNRITPWVHYNTGANPYPNHDNHYRIPVPPGGAVLYPPNTADSPLIFGLPLMPAPSPAGSNEAPRSVRGKTR